MILPFALLPLTYFVASLLTGLIALQSQQSSRKYLVAVCLTFSWLAFSNILAIFSNPDYASCLGIFILLWCSHIVHVLLIEKYKLPLPLSSTPAAITFPEKASSVASSWNWVAAYKLLYNFRWIGTRNVAPDIPAPRRYTSRAKFLAARLSSVIAIYTLQQCYNVGVAISPLSADDFLPQKEHVLRRLATVSFREIVIRCFFIIHFVWGSYAEFEFVHQLHAFVTVSIGLDDPEDWSPLFGSIKEAFTLRRFWGRFWHRLVYRSYGAYARIFSHEVLGLKKGSALDRAVRNGVVFFLSGCVHAAVTWRLGFSCGYWEDMWWFMANFLGMYSEEAFFAAVTTWLGEDVWSRPAVKKWGKVVGYLWVLAWFWWSLPKTMYPKMRCLPPSVLPEIVDSVGRVGVEMR